LANLFQKIRPSVGVLLGSGEQQITLVNQRFCGFGRGHGLGSMGELITKLIEHRACASPLAESRRCVNLNMGRREAKGRAASSRAQAKRASEGRTYTLRSNVCAACGGKNKNDTKTTMAIFHLTAKTIGRNAGRSATAAAAYRAAARIVDERTGLVFDFTRKRGVDGSEILAPDGTTLERAALWNAVEKAEKRVDAQVAREIEVALPRELSPDDMRRLVRAFVQEQFVARGMLADVAFHNLKGSNPHAHILLTLREFGAAGFGLKRREWNDRALCVEWRERWADHANAALSAAGLTARVDPRTLAEQAADAAEQGQKVKALALLREPTLHERGNPSAREQNRAIAARNAAAAIGDTTPKPLTPNAASCVSDTAFIAAMLANKGSDAARWRMYHEDAQREAAWLAAHANDEQERREQYRRERLALHNARYSRDEWLRKNRRPVWPWRWKRWRQRRAEFQHAVNIARGDATRSKTAVSSDALALLQAEHNAHRHALANALSARRRLAELPSEQQSRRCLSTAPAPNYAGAKVPTPAPEINTDERRRLRPR
jgi:hypothetical protein